MLKLVGIAIVMTATAGILFSWQEKERARIRRLKELGRFLDRTYYAMETEHVRIIAYAQQYETTEEVFSRTLKHLAELLRKNTYASGEEAWIAACKEEEKNWAFGQDAWEVLLSCGAALFGRNLAENLNMLSGMQKRTEKIIEEESCQFAEKKKVFLPVGMLGGVMIIVILL